MMTYEVNILCDVCRKCVSGAPDPTATGAICEAEAEAKNNGWALRDNQWLCPDCEEKAVYLRREDL